MMLNVFPFNPMRSCKNKIGPFEENATAKAKTQKRGINKMSATIEIKTSKKRLTDCCQIGIVSVFTSIKRGEKMEPKILK